MNVQIGSDAAEFPEKEYIIGILQCTPPIPSSKVRKLITHNLGKFSSTTSICIGLLAPILYIILTWIHEWVVELVFVVFIPPARRLSIYFLYWWRSADRPADNNHRGKNALAKNWLKIRPTYLRANTCTDLWSCFIGTVAWVVFFVHCILSRIERKDLNFFSFHVVLIFTLKYAKRSQSSPKFKKCFKSLSYILETMV